MQIGACTAVWAHSMELFRYGNYDVPESVWPKSGIPWGVAIC